MTSTTIWHGIDTSQAGLGGTWKQMNIPEIEMFGETDLFTQLLFSFDAILLAFFFFSPVHGLQGIVARLEHGGLDPGRIAGSFNDITRVFYFFFLPPPFSRTQASGT